MGMSIFIHESTSSHDDFLFRKRYFSIEKNERTNGVTEKINSCNIQKENKQKQN